MKPVKIRYREFSRKSEGQSIQGTVAAYGKEYTHYLSEEDQLRTKIGHSKNGKIASFSIRYLYYQDPEWKDVIRIDADEDECPHIHIFGSDGMSGRKQILAEADGSYERAFRASLEYIERTYQTHKDKYIK